MKITERIIVFEKLFEDLMSTNSRTEKEMIVADFLCDYPILKEDWTYILETLDGKHPIGWTFQVAENHYNVFYDSIAIAIRALEDVKYWTGLNALSTQSAERRIACELGKFLEPIVNRTLRLGIGKSLLSKSDLTPMLAKKYEGQHIIDFVCVTEKLDGNRCIAHHDGTKWCFTSRSGKPLNVAPDMYGLPTEYIYDGELMSSQQTKLSMLRCDDILLKFYGRAYNQYNLFNETAGLINNKSDPTKKDLIYNIFDIIKPGISYRDRRVILDGLSGESIRPRIVPSLYYGNNIDNINILLDKISYMGGEGIMLNLASGEYEHKRSSELLKYKKVQTMDMKVLDIFEGKGKYEGMVGGLLCTMTTSDGKEITCEVGSGLNDAQREEWADNPEDIIGKTIEVAYHELTQDARNKNTHRYSLRFPRLKIIRADKDDTSEF